jgi:hypothetical protein
MSVLCSLTFMEDTTTLHLSRGVRSQVLPMLLVNGIRGLVRETRFRDGGASGVSRAGDQLGVSVVASGGDETRPKNIYMNWIIKYK